MKVTEAIGNFLRAQVHNAPELVSRWTPAMETQVNVGACNGEPVDGKPNTYSNDQFTWWNIRVPKKAKTEPEWKDYELQWPLDLFAEGIGSTGWDWQNRVSRWFGYDFDSMTGHAAGVGITDQELENVKQAAMALPYVEVRKSTGGNGIHLYVLLDGVPTANHTEHASLGHCILSRMSSECKFDFASKVDTCGGNMWIWHRKMTPENDGLKLIKAAEHPFTDVPPNWRDHIEVVTKRRTKIRVNGLSDSEMDIFESLTSGQSAVPLDETHKAIINEVGKLGYSCVWVPDHHLVQTHTCGLRDLLECHKEELGLKGGFSTNSPGTDKASPNCFCYPIENGGFKVIRFGKGARETSTWLQDGKGWTSCEFNVHPKYSAVKPYQPFPIESLPRVVGDYVASASSAIGCDPAYIALPLLACLARAIGNKRVIQLKPGWIEPAIIWGAIVGVSGTHKTPAMQAAMKFLQSRQETIMLRHTTAMKDYDLQMQVYQRDLANWKKSKNVESQPKPPLEPVCERYVTVDTTIEALIMLLAQQFDGLLVARDELAGWLGGMGQYKTGEKRSDLSHWLTSWSAQSITYDRKSGPRKTLHVPRASASVIGGIQPMILQAAIGREHLQDGLCARLLLAMPDKRSVRWTEETVNPQIEGAINHLFDKLLAMEASEEPIPISLSADAKDIWIRYYNQHRAEMDELDPDLSMAWPKLEAYTARFALLFQLCSWATGEAEDNVVNVASMESAIKLSEWFGGEARRVYSMFDKSTKDRELWDLVEMIATNGEDGRITPRQLAHCSQRYRASGAAVAALERLVEAKRGKWVKSTPGPSGGRPSMVFELAS